MKAVLTLWAERSWESTGQMALNRTRIARSAPREPLLAGIENGALHSHPKVCSAARVSVVCLGAAIFLASPGGALRPGLVPAGWGALGRCLLARFGGETAPPLVLSIGLTCQELHVAQNFSTTSALAGGPSSPHPLAKGQRLHPAQLVGLPRSRPHCWRSHSELRN
jgi:hypothetical protein